MAMPTLLTTPLREGDNRAILYGANGNPINSDAAGNLQVALGLPLTSALDSISTQGGLPSYYAFGTIAAIANASSQDIVALFTNFLTVYTRLARVRIWPMFTSGAAANVIFNLIRRTSSATGGTTAAVTIDKYNPNSAAATAQVLNYTAYPSAYPAGFTMRTSEILVPVVTTLPNPPALIDWHFESTDVEMPTAIPNTETFWLLNISPSVPSNLSLTVLFEWSENAT